MFTISSVESGIPSGVKQEEPKKQTSKSWLAWVLVSTLVGSSVAIVLYLSVFRRNTGALSRGAEGVADQPPEPLTAAASLKPVAIYPVFPGGTSVEVRGPFDLMFKYGPRLTWEYCGSCSTVNITVDGSKLKLQNDTDTRRMLTIYLPLLSSLKTVYDRGLIHVSDQVSFAPTVFISLCDEYRVMLERVVSDKVELIVDCKSDCVVNCLVAEECSVVAESMGRVSAKGTSKKTRIVARDFGNVDFGGVRSVDTEIVVSALAVVSTETQKSLNVDMRGECDLEYYGNPEKVTKKGNGAGKLVKK
jgi:hypothetical protein